MNPPKINKVKNRFLPIDEAVLKGLEPEPKISDFEILKELGAGSFGRVYLVTHKITKAQYAIKAIDKRNKTNIEEKPYFRREIEIMYKIHHPNVVRLFSHFEDDNYCYFIMEFVQKGNIYSLISQDKTKRLSNHLIANLMKDVISAVYFLHKMNPPIIHRDIKPENVLLAEGNVAKLTDFGWSNYMQDDEKRTTVCGTPIYLAPEIIDETGHDEKVDVWCIGILLFELSTGNIPFLGNNIETLKSNIRNMNISWPRDINPEIKNLISKILKYDPKARISIPEILNHSFFTTYIDNPTQYLITPDEQTQYKPFIVSTDNPKDPPVIINKMVKEIQPNTKPIRKKSANKNTIPSIEDINAIGIKIDFNDLKNKYKELSEEYQALLNNKGNNAATSNNKEIEELIEKKDTLTIEYNSLIEEVKEKENKIKQLMNNNSKGKSDSKVSSLEKENKLLKEKIEKYENELGTTNGDSFEFLKEYQNIFKLVQDIQNDMSDDMKMLLMKILKEKEKEIQIKKDLKEKDKIKHSTLINKCNSKLYLLNKENIELKSKLKELEKEG
jgi:aurora kinase